MEEYRIFCSSFVPLIAFCIQMSVPSCYSLPIWYPHQSPLLNWILYYRNNKVQDKERGEKKEKTLWRGKGKQKRPQKQTTGEGWELISAMPLCLTNLNLFTCTRKSKKGIISMYCWIHGIFVMQLKIKIKRVGTGEKMWSFTMSFTNPPQESKENNENSYAC